jgi:hypothetical protein
VDGNQIGVFTGKRPKRAALKAANRIYPDISLSERGSKGAYIYRRAKTDKKILRENHPGCTPRSGSPMSRKQERRYWRVSESISFSVYEAKDLISEEHPAGVEDKENFFSPPAPSSLRALLILG